MREGCEHVTEDEVRAELRSYCDAWTVRSTAQQIGVSLPFLHAVLGKKKPVGKRIPAFFELQPETVFTRKRGPRRRAPAE